MDKKFITSYTGIPSFFQAPIIEPNQVKEGMTVVAGVPMDLGTVIARPGARYGPRGIREASLMYRGSYEVASEHTLIDVDTEVFLRLKETPNFGDIGDFDISPTNIMETTETVIQGVSDIVKRGGFPVVLGGDHYVAYPSFEGFARGIAERKPNPRLGYLHIDTHPDFRDQHGVGGKYTHGTAARRISEDTAISYRNMAWVGLNGAVIDTDQYRIFKTQRLKMLSAKVIREKDVAEVVREAMETVADGTDAVYVSIDIDIVDGSQSPGTGVPVYSGIGASEFLRMMEVLSTYDVIGAIDLCEVATPLDPGGRTTHLAANGLLNLLGPRLFDTIDFDQPGGTG